MYARNALLLVAHCKVVGRANPPAANPPGTSTTIGAAPVPKHSTTQRLGVSTVLPPPLALEPAAQNRCVEIRGVALRLLCTGRQYRLFDLCIQPLPPRREIRQLRHASPRLRAASCARSTPAPSLTKLGGSRGFRKPITLHAHTGEVAAFLYQVHPCSFFSRCTVRSNISGAG